MKNLLFVLLLLPALAFADCDPPPVGNPTFTPRGNFTRCKTNACSWDVCLQTMIDEHDSRDALLGVVGTFTAAQTFNAHTLLDKGSEVFNVRAYGATGDGSTDDTTAVQAAATACAAVRGIVFFPVGSYKTSATITFTDCIVKGAGTTLSRLLPTAAVVGSPAVIITDSIHSGALRPAGMEDFNITCNSAGVTKGLHMTNAIDGIRLDTSAQLTNIRVQYCENGIVPNAATGHQSLIRVQLANNYCGIRPNLLGSGGTDGGNLDVISSAIVGSSFAGVCIPANGPGGAGTGAGLTDAHFTRTDIGFSPYAFWQEGPATGAFLGATIFDDVAFEAIGNGAFYAKNKSGIGGALTALDFRFIGYSDSSADTNIHLPSADCTADNTPYQCCRTGTGVGCESAYPLDAGTCNVLRFYSGTHPFATPSVGGTGAIHCTACQSKIQVTVEAGSTPVVTCDTNPFFVQIEDGNGAKSWQGLTPTNSPVTCASTNNGALYFDTSLKQLCYCDGSIPKWCDVKTNTCTSSTSCG